MHVFLICGNLVPGTGFTFVPHTLEPIYRILNIKQLCVIGSFFCDMAYFSLAVAHKTQQILVGIHKENQKAWQEVIANTEVTDDFL